MNERIKQLAKQADAHAHNRLAEIGGSYLEYYNKKFAKLIVRECMKLNHDILCEDDPNYLDQVYKEHFGVEV